MIYIAAHKKVDLPAMAGYEIVQAGAAQHDALPYISDASGENISAKNPYYCELTVLYWAWKNSTADYKGLVHYRRFFGRNELSSDLSTVYSESELRAMLTDADIVLPKPEYLLDDAKTDLCKECCRPEVFDKLREIISSRYPDYIPAFDNLFKGDKVSLYNMMYARSEVFDSYCEWLFSIFFELEGYVDMTGYTPFQQRLYGFVSERLLNVWCARNGMRIAEVPVVNTELPLYDKVQGVRRRYTNRFRFWLRTVLRK